MLFVFRPTRFSAAAPSVFLAATLALSCGSGPECSDAVEVACRCPDGSLGVAPCGADGTRERCVCPDTGVADTGGDVASGDVLPDASRDGAGDTPAADTPADVGPGHDVGPGNLCGGELSLVHDGTVASPGGTCGACEDGVLLCDGPDALRCAGATEPNACGDSKASPTSG